MSTWSRLALLSFKLHCYTNSKDIKRFYYFFNDHKTCRKENCLVQVFMKPCLKRCCRFHIWNVDPSLHQNNRTRYSRKTEAKEGTFPWKEPDVAKQASLQSPKCLGTQTSVEKKTFFFALLVPSDKRRFWKSTRPRYQSTRLGQADKQKFFALIMVHYYHSLSTDAKIMVSQNCPITSEHVGFILRQNRSP